MICSALATGNHLEWMEFVAALHTKHDKRKPRAAGSRARSARPAPPDVQPEAPQRIADDEGFPNSLGDALDPSSFPEIETVQPEWERQNHWEQRVKMFESSNQVVVKKSKVRVRTTAKQAEPESTRYCTVHHGQPCPQSKANEKIGSSLDNQFNYLLSLAESYKIFVDVNDSDRCNLWMQALARIGRDWCVNMKGIRNDYMVLLCGKPVEFHSPAHR